ncbi:hypothetical protein GC176_07195 [bacterium]|nr:hypothetical protein [bacterium]
MGTWLVVMLAMLSGCGQRPITGGTSGVLLTDGNPIPDVLVRIYSTDADTSLGYAVTSGDGSFELVAQDSTGPLHLEPGSYIMVLESVGAPTELPEEYLDRDSTPLKMEWTSGDVLKLNVPGLSLN